MRILAAALSLALVLAPVAGTAEVTAHDAWRAWRALVEVSGARTGAESVRMDRGRVLLDGLFLEFGGPNGTISAELGEAVIEDAGEGNMRLRLRERIPVAVTWLRPEGGSGELRLEAGLSGFELLARGTTEGIRFEMRADAVTLTTPVGRSAEGGVAHALVLRGLAIRFDTGSDSSRSTLFSDTLKIRARGAGTPTTPREALYSFSARELSADGIGFLAVTLGLAGEGHPPRDGAIRMGRSELLIPGGVGSFGVRLGLESAEVHRSTSNGTTRIRGRFTELSARPEQDVASLPPLKLSAATAGWEIRLPGAAPGGPESLSATARLDGLDLGPRLWAYLDPERQLERTPGRVRLELGTTAGWLGLLPGHRSGTPRSDPRPTPVEIEEFGFGFLGVEVSGSGQFEPAPRRRDGLEGWDGITGELDLTVTGMAELLRRLRATGRIGQAEVETGLTILDIFSRTGPGPDTRRARIALDGTGGITSEGQRIR